jgi:hypothetical protein
MFARTTTKASLRSILTLIRTKLTLLGGISQERGAAVLTQGFNLVSCLLSAKQILAVIRAKYPAEHICRASTRTGLLYLEGITALFTTSRKCFVRRSAI